MVDLEDFYLGTYTWGEMYLECRCCCWSVQEERWETLGDLVRLAEGHACAVVVEGELAAPELSPGVGGG
jgi:hypothetical protein